MRASLRYTLARLLIFFVCLGVCWLLGLRNDPVLLVLVAATASMVISLFALNGMRSQFATDIAQRAERRRTKTAQRRRDGIVDETAEEAELDAQPVQDTPRHGAHSDVESDRQK